MRYIVLLLIFVSCIGKNEQNIESKKNQENLEFKISWKSDKGICFSEEKIKGGSKKNNYIFCDCDCSIEENRIFFPKKENVFYALNSVSQVYKLKNISNHNNFFDTICDNDRDLNSTFNIGGEKYLPLFKTPENCYEIGQDKPSVEQLSIERFKSIKKAVLYNEVSDSKISTDLNYFLNKSISEKLFEESNDSMAIGRYFYILNAIKDKDNIVWIQVLYNDSVRWVKESETNIKVVWS